MGFVLGEFVFLEDMAGELAEGLFQRFQRFKILTGRIVLLHSADLGLQRLMRFAQLVQQAFDMACHGGRIVLGVLKPGDEPKDRVIHAGDGKGRTRLCRFNTLGQLVDGAGGRVRSQAAALIRRGHFVRSRRFRRHQKAI